MIFPTHYSGFQGTRHPVFGAPAILSLSDPLFSFWSRSIMGDKVRVLHWGNLMDIFYNHLSAFSADSLPHQSSDVGNTTEMTRFLSPQETSIKRSER